MAIDAETLIVRFEADISDLEQKVSQVNEHVGKTGGFLKTAASSLVGFAGGQLLVHGLASAFSFAKEATFGFNQSMQASQVGFETMLGSSAKAKSYLNDLFQFAAKTPFEFEPVKNYAQQLMAMGINAKDVIPDLTAMGDATAALGRGPEVVGQITLALGQMQAKGHVAGGELLQLTEAGIPALRYLAQGFGVSTDQMQAMISKGIVPSDKAIRILTQGMEHDYGGAMQKMSQTFAGAMSTIHDTAQQALGVALKPLFDAAQARAVMFANFLSSPGFAAGLSTFQKVVSSTLTNVGGLFSGVGPVVGKVLHGIGDAFQAVLPTLQQLRPSFHQIVDVVGSLIPAFGQLEGVLNPTIVIWKALGPALLQLLPPLAAIVAEIAGQLVGTLWDIIPPVTTVVSTLIGMLAPAFISIVKAALPLVPIIGQVLVGAIQTLSPLLVGIAGVLANVATQMQNSTPLGSALKGVVIGLVGAFALWKVGSIATDLVTLGRSMGAMVVTIIQSLPVIIAQTAAWAANAVMVLAATWPFLAIGAAIVGVIAIGVLLITHWKQVTDFIGNVWKGVLTWLAGAWQGLQKAASDAWSAVGAIISGAVSRIGTFVHDTFFGIINGVVGLFTGFMTFVGQVWSSIINTLVGWFMVAYNHSYLFKAIVDTIVGVFNFAKAFIALVWADITGALTHTWATIQGVASFVWNAIVNGISLYINTMRTVITTVWNAVSGFLGGIWEGIRRAASDVWNRISGVIGDFIGLEEKGIHIVWDAVSKWLSKIWDTIKGAASTAWQAIHDTIIAPVQKVFDDIGKIMGGLKKAAGDWAGGMKDGFINGVTGAWDAISKALGVLAQNIIDFVKHALGIHSPSTVFADIGHNAILGFISGFTGNDITGQIGNFITNSLGGFGDVIRSLIGTGVIDVGQIGNKGLGFLRSLGSQAADILGSIVNGVFGGGAVNGAPLINQLKMLDQNNRDDCVPAAIASGASAILGRFVDPTLLKDAVYGARYQGFQSPDRYMPELASLGVSMSKEFGSPLQLIANAIHHINTGHPVVATIPSQWNLQSSQANSFSHVVALVRAMSNMVTAMNPWGGFWQIEPSTWWAQRLRYNSIYPMSGRGGGGGGHMSVMDTGGIITEPVVGIGLRSRGTYGLAMNGRPEYVVPSSDLVPMGQQKATTIIHVHGDLTESTAARLERERAWTAQLHGGH